MKTDAGGNSYGQVMMYSRGLPNGGGLLGLELSCASLRVDALARFGKRLYLEPLTAAEPCFLVNDQSHMWALAQICEGIKRAVDELAADAGAGVARSAAASPMVPCLIRELWPNALCQQLQPQSPVYLLQVYQIIS